MCKNNKPNPQKNSIVFNIVFAVPSRLPFGDRQYGQHGYSNLVKQPSWRSIMFCVYVQVHRSKTVAVFA